MGALRWLILGCLWLPVPAVACPWLDAQPRSGPVSVVQVYDGDTVKLADGRKVRVLGINAPEMGRDGRPDEPLARAATQAARAWLSGRQIHLVTDKETRDRYGRWLAHLVDDDGASLSEQLLTAGLAWPVVVPPNEGSATCDQTASAKARDAGRGLWSSPPQAAAALAAGGFARIAGRVTEVTRSRNGDIWLTLDDALAVQIRQPDQQAFARLPDASWRGRQLEVSGWVQDRRGDARVKARGYPGFRVQLRHPAMLR